MKIKTRVIAVVMCLSLFTFMALGSGSSGTTVDKEISEVSNPTNEDAAVAETDSQDTQTSDSSSTSDSEVTIEEQVLFDENDIKITATGLEDSLFGTELKLLIENNSSQSITVQARDASVNGYMVSTMMSADVASGKKANTELTFATSGLKESGIEKMATMEFIFHIFASDSWEEILDTDVIVVNTSVADGYVQTYDDSGEILVDTNDVKIVGKGLSVDGSFWGPGVILYIENNSDRDITVQVRDVSINGYMVTSSMSEDVIVGKKAISAVQFFDTELEDNSITDITDVELYFHIFDKDTWDPIFDSDVISINF